MTASHERPTLGLFEGYGIELEYMIVDAKTLAVSPIADRLIEAESGSIENEIERGDFAWSNELARHVIEMKTNGPVSSLAGLADGFSAQIRRMNERLAPMGARLMPTAMHPWMDPEKEFEIWPHGAREIYETFDRIFSCQGHGWANLQSMHVNLPFRDDEEFGRLHAAIRAILPLLPALAASSPYIEGRFSGHLDARLDVYKNNAARVPSVSGWVIPEPVYTRAAYTELLESIYRDLEPHDREGILRHEWVNARGCIARFDRMALEIRVLDLQETPIADIAIAALVSDCVERLCGLSEKDSARLRSLDTSRLRAVLDATIQDAELARIEDVEFLDVLQLGSEPRLAHEIWALWIDRFLSSETGSDEFRVALETIRDEGSLATRIRKRLRALAGNVDAPAREHLAAVYGELADCANRGRLYHAER
jgi:gamma-glutamyl:cysteine ligase YbdK (ATP-grasp superfamily)